jgi:hypothetical protein
MAGEVIQPSFDMYVAAASVAVEDATEVEEEAEAQADVASAAEAVLVEVVDGAEASAVLVVEVENVSEAELDELFGAAAAGDTGAGTEGENVVKDWMVKITCPFTGGCRK